MTWVLIWVFMHDEGLTSGTQEFNTQQACEVAAKELNKAGFLRLGINDVIKCVPKGDK